MGCTITVSSRKTHEIIKSNLATEQTCDLQSVRKEKLTPRNWTSVVKAGGIGGGGGVCFFKYFFYIKRIIIFFATRYRLVFKLNIPVICYILTVFCSYFFRFCIYVIQVKQIS